MMYAASTTARASDPMPKVSTTLVLRAVAFRASWSFPVTITATVSPTTSTALSCSWEASTPRILKR